MEFLQTPNKHLASLLEFNTYGWWMMATDKCMMNCTFRLKWEIDIISNTWRSCWWSKHLTLLLISNDKHFPSVPHNRLLKELNVVVDSGPPAPPNTYFVQILLLASKGNRCKSQWGKDLFGRGLCLLTAFLFITVETAKSETWILNVRQDSLFFHFAQQEIGLRCLLSEDFVHWLSLPLRPLEFLQIKKE